MALRGGLSPRLSQPEAMRIMPVIEEGIERIEQEFADAKIATDEPGFYEDPAFIRREARIPNYLDNYARFVQQQPYSLSYLDRAEPIIHVVSEELQLALKEDGTPEAHAEATLVMSRILEREGVWNYVARGGLSMAFPPGSGFEPFRFPAFNVQAASRSIAPIAGSSPRRSRSSTSRSRRAAILIRSTTCCRRSSGNQAAIRRPPNWATSSEPMP